MGIGKFRFSSDTSSRSRLFWSPRFAKSWLLSQYKIITSDRANIGRPCDPLTFGSMNTENYLTSASRDGKFLWDPISSWLESLRLRLPRGQEKLIAEAVVIKITCNALCVVMPPQAEMTVQIAALEAVEGAVLLLGKGAMVWGRNFAVSGSASASGATAIIVLKC